MKKKLNKEFLDKLTLIYTEEDLKLINDAFSCEKRKTSFRVNTLKSTNEEIEKYLKDKNIAFTKINFLTNAYILDEAIEKDLWNLDIFTDGKIYLQSISSQIPVSTLDIKAGDKILDITASPGGKTTQASAILKNGGEIIAVDNNAIRIDKLNFTLKRQGANNVKVIKSDAKEILKSYPGFENYFDKIIADLPCSAEGKFNLNQEKSYAYWNEAIVKKNYNIQKDIMRSIIDLLKVGGELVYSTCTLSVEENEDIVHMILSNYPQMILKDISVDFEYARPGVLKFKNKVFKSDMKKTLRIIPSVLSEGFFIAKFEKIVLNG